MGRASARVASLLIGASLAPAPVRKLLLVALFVGLSGLAAAYLLGERLPIVAVLQAQPWRTMWLVFSLATMASAICCLELWPRGGSARIVLALLALSWVYADFDSSMLLAATAVVVHFFVSPHGRVVSRTSAALVVLIASGLVVVGLIHTEVSIASTFGGTADALASDARRTLALDWDYTPLAVLAAVFAIFGPRRPSKPALIAVALGGVLLLTATWDRRSDADRYFDSGAGVPDLARLIATKPGEVLWVGGVRESWSWLARPQWISPIQGAGIVFSRPLAILYRDRSKLAMNAGLLDGSVLAPFADLPRSRMGEIDPAKLAAFCAAPSAPAWIVVPVGEYRIPATIPHVDWTAPVAKTEMTAAPDGRTSWKRVSHYAIVPCST